MRLIPIASALRTQLRRTSYKSLLVRGDSDTERIGEDEVNSNCVRTADAIEQDP
jgi:hypothetical protein